MRTTDVLDQLDATLDDWAVGPDAMRYTPDRGTPAVGGNRAAGRELLVRRLVENHDLTRTTARRAIIAAEARRTTSHTPLVHAEARTAADEAMRSVRAAFRPMVETMAETMKELKAAFERMRAAVPAATCPCPDSRSGRRTDRPAWQSPYGPATRRR